jgi:hypothetical protein
VVDREWGIPRKYRSGTGPPRRHEGHEGRRERERIFVLFVSSWLTGTGVFQGSTPQAWDHHEGTKDAKGAGTEKNLRAVRVFVVDRDWGIPREYSSGVGPPRRHEGLEGRRKGTSASCVAGQSPRRIASNWRSSSSTSPGLARVWATSARSSRRYRSRSRVTVILAAPSVMPSFAATVV